MKKNTLLIIISIIILTLAGYGYYRLFVAPHLSLSTQLPEVNLMGSYEIPHRASGLFVNGNYAYVGAGKSIIEIIDISNPSQPVLVKTEGIGIAEDEARDFYSSDSYVYVAVDSGIHILDFTEGVGYYETKPVTSQSITGINNYLFLGTDFGLFIFDISNPQKPVLAGRYDRNLSIYSISVISNEYLYLTGHLKNTPAEEDYRFHIVDISDKSNPVAAKKYKKEIIPRAMQITDNTGYALSSTSSKSMISVVDLSDPKNPVLIREYQENMSYYELYILNQYLLQASDKGILSVDISDLDKYVPIKGLPETLGTFTASDNYIYSVIKNPDQYANSILRIFEIR